MALTQIQGSGISNVTISADGEVTKAAQPAFLVFPASNQNNIAINAATDIVFATEVFDVGANFASNTFTAPITGKYVMSFVMYLMNLDIDTQYYSFNLITSNRTYYNAFSPNFSADAEYQNFNFSGVLDMDASDTAKVSISIPNNGAAQADLYGDGSFFSGALIC